MGQYKVPQDVESEDKLIGPLSLRQFIYIIIAVGWAGFMFALFGRINLIIVVLAALPVSGFFLLLGLGRRQEQSFESYFVALVRFFVIPRIRLWQKDSSTDMVVKESPKKVEIHTEKHVTTGSLKQLASIMDTRGYQKDSSIQLQDETNPATAINQRILDPSQVASTPGQTIAQVATPQDDVLNEASPRQAEVGQLLENVEQGIHEQAVKQVTKDLKTAPAQATSTPQAASQAQPSDAILKMATLQGGNLTVEQLARQANEQQLTEGQEVSLNPA
jgi:hypothetical protein